MSKKHKKSPVHRHISKNGVESLIKPAYETTKDKVKIYKLSVSDGYHSKRYKAQRALFYNNAKLMNWYLKKRPHITFEHKHNFVRKFLYALPSFSKWSKLMVGQGAMAMGPLHNPEIKRLASGHRIDPITRRLFRHGADPVGIRTRTITAGWLAKNYIDNYSRKKVKWLSVAGGSAVPSMVMVAASKVNKQELYYTDIDVNEQAIELAKKATHEAELKADNTQLIVGDIFDEQLLEEAGVKSDVDIVDMMGILEYLGEKQASHLIKLYYSTLKPGGVILTCNMRSSHPQLDLHKRGVGWPGVIPRNTQQLIEICRGAGVKTPSISVYQTQEGVYNVVRIEKN